MSDETVQIPKSALMSFAQSVQENLQSRDEWEKSAAQLIDNVIGEEMQKAARSTIDDLIDQGVLPDMEETHKQAYAENMATSPRQSMELARRIGSHLADAKVKVATAEIGTEVDVSSEDETPEEKFDRQMNEVAMEL